MKRAKMKLVVDPTSILLHKVSASTGGKMSDFSIRYLARNQIYYARKFHGLLWAAYSAAAGMAIGVARGGDQGRYVASTDGSPAGDPRGLCNGTALSGIDEKEFWGNAHPDHRRGRLHRLADRRALAERGDSVTVLDNFSEQIHGTDIESSPTYQMASRVAQVVKGDVRDRDLMFELVPRFDAVVHLAAETGTGQSMYDIIRYNDVNVMGTAILLEALVNDPGEVRRLVIASSRSVYGEGSYTCDEHGIVYPGERDVTALEAGRFEPVCPVCAAPIAAAHTTEAAALAPASVYAVTKLAQEHLMLAMGHARGIPTVALRYQNVYGPGQSLNNPYTGILSIFSREMLAGRPVEIFEDGLESRDFVHVDDVALANVAAAHGELSGVHVANIGTGKATTVLELANALARNYGYRGDIRISGRFRAGDIRHNFAAIDAAKKALGWSPSISFDEGLSGFCGWVRETLTETGTSSTYDASLKELEKRGLISGG